MLGSVRATKPKCAQCGGKWETILHPRKGEPIDLMCPQGHVPRSFFVDGRSFRNRKGAVGYLHRDENGRLLTSFDAAFRLLESIRHDYDKDALRFDPTRWSQSGRESRKVADVWWAWHDEVSATRSKGYAVGIRCQGELHVLPIIGETDIRELTRDDLFRIEVEMRNKGLSAQSRRSAFEKVKSCLKYAQDNRMIGKDDLPRFPDVKVGRRERYWVDDATQEKGISAMPKEAQLLMRVLSETGMRPGEGCALKRMDILPEGRIYVQRALDYWRKEGPPKNGRARYVSISAELLDALLRVPALPDAYLFRMPSGRPWSTGDLSHAFRAAARRIGLPEEVTLYTFTRHTTASRIAQEAERMAVRAASEVLGNTARMAREHYIQGTDTLVVACLEGK